MLCNCICHRSAPDPSRRAYASYHIALVIPGTTRTDNLGDGLDRQGAIKPLLRVIFRLQLLQLPQVLTVVDPLSGLPIEVRVGVVDVHAPVGDRQGSGDGIHPTGQALGTVGGIGAVGNAVVLLNDVQLVAVSVRRLAVAGRGNSRVHATVHVQLEPPVAVGDLGGVVEPVIDEVRGRRAGGPRRGRARGGGGRARRE